MKKLKKNKGITLIALVITIIVLLILAGVSLSAVFNQDGIFSRAEQATDKYGQAKARETLELCLSEAQMRKYESGLTEEQLDEEISKVGSLLPKEDENSNNQLVIVEGHIFEIDRSVPKVVDYKGPANGVIITAKITQNGDWENPVATVTGTITKYGGGTVVSSTATATNGVTIPSEFPTTGGNYTIGNITTDTDITINTTDSEGKTASKTIHVVLVRDDTAPVISEQTAKAMLMKITISAKATDSESGLASLRYSIAPNTIKDGKAEGTLNANGTGIEVEATSEGDYTVTFTATDNAGNTSTATAGPVRASDAISIADLKKEINAENYPDYIGTKVDYSPEAGGTWRVFYYDASGEFGDGAGTIYLKRDYDTTMTLSSYVSSGATANGEAMMKQLNPKWAASENGKKARANYLNNEKAAAGLCDTNNWTTYKTSEAKYAIGGAPIEMWCKAQNAYKNKYDTSASTIGCGIKNANGYGYTINGGSLVDYQSTTVVNTSIPQSAVIATGSYQWLASPSSYDAGAVCIVYSSRVTSSGYGGDFGVCPVVSLNH